MSGHTRKHKKHHSRRRTHRGGDLGAIVNQVNDATENAATTVKSAANEANLKLQGVSSAAEAAVNNATNQVKSNLNLAAANVSEKVTNITAGGGRKSKKHNSKRKTKRVRFSKK